MAGCATQRDIYYLGNRLAVLEKNYKKAENLNYLAERLAVMEKDYTNAEKKNEAFRARITGTQIAGFREEFEKIMDDIQILSEKINQVDYLLKQKINVLSDSDNISNNKLNAFNTRIEQKTKLLDSRIIQLEQFLNLEKDSYSKGKKNTKINKSLLENNAYLFAKQIFDSGDFAKARALFNDFLNKYPKSNKADNAQFWISESFYSEKWFEKAILEYQKVIEKYPKGNKTKSAILKQGFSFFNIGDNANARIVLNDLIKKYPKSKEAGIARKKLKKL